MDAARRTVHTARYSRCKAATHDVSLKGPGNDARTHAAFEPFAHVTFNTAP